MRAYFFGAILSLGASAAEAASPSGEWLVADKSARVSVQLCGARLSGVISWERTHGLDDHNPDPAKRSRPTLGLPIFIGMQATGADAWSGSIYNADDGKTYDSKIRMLSASALRVEGCVLGFLCGGETWTKVGEGKGDCPKTTPAPSMPQRPTR